MSKLFDGKRILITGGTGSLGKILTHRILSGEAGHPAKVIIFSRDEAKQHFFRVEYDNHVSATDEIIYRNFQRSLEFRIGDVRDIGSVAAALRDADIVVNAAALKQVPTCEYFPFEAVRTNVQGAENIVRAIQEHSLGVETVVGVSTDKACKPTNVMGMCKALQERVLIQGNMRCPGTRFICTRYGNVLASRGSVIPFFHDQIRSGGPVTITTREMTRFLLSLDDAVDLIFAALAYARPGETWVPRARAAKIVDVAAALIGDRGIATTITGIRPGEKIHEILVSDEEAYRTSERDRWLVIRPMLPEIDPTPASPGGRCLDRAYSSAENVMTADETRAMLRTQHLMLEDQTQPVPELLR